MLSAFPKHTQQTRPLQPGASISRVDHEAGTLTAVVRKTFAPNERYMLSCEHVLAPLSRQSSAQICQPANSDIYGAGKFNVVASGLIRYGVDPRNTNSLDAALAQVRGDVQSDNAVLNTGFRLQSVASMDSVSIGQDLVMVGRTSGITTGALLSRNFSATLGQQHFGFVTPIRFQGLARASYKSASGDSGAPVLIANTGQLVGMHVGGNSDQSVAFFYPIESVFQYFQINLA